MTKSTALSVLLLFTIGACSAGSDEALLAGPEQTRANQQLRWEFYVYQNVERRTWQAQEAGSGSGYASAEFEGRIARILRQATEEGLMQPPDCGGLELPDRRPAAWVHHIGVHGTQLEVEVIAECETEPPVSEDFDGAIDVWWEEGVVLEYGSQCRHSFDNETRTMSCDAIERYDESSTVSYPSLRQYEMDTWEYQVDTECEGAICYIQELDLWPSDPATGETQVFEADCEDHPDFCSLIVEILDPRDLVTGDGDEEDEAPQDDLEPKEGASQDCQDTIRRYNEGSIGCTASVAECAAGGECHRTHEEYEDSEGDGGYTNCKDDGVNATCTTCEETTKEGCKKGHVEVTPTGPRENTQDQQTAANDFNDALRDAGYPPSDATWHTNVDSEPTPGQCRIVNSGSRVGTDVYHLECY